MMIEITVGMMTKMTSITIAVVFHPLDVVDFDEQVVDQGPSSPAALPFVRAGFAMNSPLR